LPINVDKFQKTTAVQQIPKNNKSNFKTAALRRVSIGINTLVFYWDLFYFFFGFYFLSKNKKIPDENFTGEVVY
jgi:hypothetical protein